MKGVLSLGAISAISKSENAIDQDSCYDEDSYDDEKGINLKVN